MSALSLEAIVLLVGAVALPAAADAPLPRVESETVQLECGSCHMTYPPQLLPERSWTRLMDGLGDHFGEELELDTETSGEVRAYLRSHSADRSRHEEASRFLRGLHPGDVPIRITETPGWQRKHRELPDRVWSDERVGFRGHCEACHTRAEEGRFDEDAHLRVPEPGGRWRTWDDD